MQDSDIYCIAGSFNSWKLQPMALDDDMDGLYYHTIVLGPKMYEEFQLVVNHSWSKRIHPSKEQAPLGSVLEGPHAGGEGRNWLIDGAMDAVFEVTLDLKQEDRRHMVKWKQIAGPGAAVAGSTMDGGEVCE